MSTRVCERPGCDQETVARGGGHLCTLHLGQRRRWKERQYAALTALLEDGVLDHELHQVLVDKVRDMPWMPPRA